MNPILKHSKVISILYEDKKSKDRLTLRQQNKSKMNFLAIEIHSDKISRKLNNYRRIADEIVLKNKLFNSSGIDSYMLSATTIKTSAYNRRHKDKKK